MHPFFHIWIGLALAALAAAIVVSHRRGWDSFGRALMIGMLVVGSFGWSFLLTFGVDPDKCDYNCGLVRDARVQSQIDAEAYKARGIACAEQNDNDSGNVCRTRIGDQECVTVLPDDDTKTELHDVDLTRCVPVKEDA